MLARSLGVTWTGVRRFHRTNPCEEGREEGTPVYQESTPRICLRGLRWIVLPCSTKSKKANNGGSLWA
eukprot:2157-Amphidinium_carterae.1